MIEAAYVLFLAISQRVYFPLLKVFGFKLLGVLMASVQLIPTIMAISSTNRPIHDLAYQGEYSFHPINFLQSISPYYFNEPIVPYHCIWEGTMYTGNIALVLCIWLLTRKEDWLKHRAIVTIALLLTVLGLPGNRPISAYLSSANECAAVWFVPVSGQVQFISPFRPVHISGMRIGMFASDSVPIRDHYQNPSAFSY